MKKAFPKIDRTAFSVIKMEDQEEDLKRYWHSKTPRERLEAVELMRQLNYDYDPATDRVQRVLEVVERPRR